MIPGSMLRKLEAITGLKASKSSPSCYRLDIAEGVAFFAMVKDEKEACAMLRADNWRRVVYMVSKAQEWRCKSCRQVKPLQGHHVLFRSRWRRIDGPLDVESNTHALCADCHQDEHL